MEKEMKVRDEVTKRTKIGRWKFERGEFCQFTIMNTW